MKSDSDLDFTKIKCCDYDFDIEQNLHQRFSEISKQDVQKVYDTIFIEDTKKLEIHIVPSKSLNSNLKGIKKRKCNIILEIESFHDKHTDYYNSKYVS